MKIAEAIRNVTGLIAVMSLGFSMFAGFMANLLTKSENVTFIVAAFLIGSISFAMDKIAE